MWNRRQSVLLEVSVCYLPGHSAPQFAWTGVGEGGVADIQFVANVSRRRNTRRAAAAADAACRKSSKNKIELIETKSALLTSKKGGGVTCA